MSVAPRQDAAGLCTAEVSPYTCCQNTWQTVLATPRTPVTLSKLSKQRAHTSAHAEDSASQFPSPKGGTSSQPCEAQTSCRSNLWWIRVDLCYHSLACLPHATKRSVGTSCEVSSINKHQQTMDHSQKIQMTGM